MYIKQIIKPVEKTNPIGRATDALESDIFTLIEQWELENSKSEKKWWEFWKSCHIKITTVVSFLINCVDYLILKVENFKELSGPDKKATVLRVIEILYNHIIKESLPIWLKPIAQRIKYFIIHVWISYIIDFMVKKYREGLWREINEKEHIEGND